MILKNSTSPSLLALLFLSASCGQIPERFDCGTEKDLSIEQRIEQCNETKTLANGQALSLVARKYVKAIVDNASSVVIDQQFGEIQEFHKDPSTGLIWQTSSNNIALSQEDAKKICESKKALNLRWRLPSHIEFLKFGNFTKDEKQSVDQNHQIKEIFESTFDRRYINNFHFWTSSIAPTNNKALLNSNNKRPLVFKETSSEIAPSSNSNKPFLVQCVSDGNFQAEEKKEDPKKPKK
ncbi:MAG: hypothetical protein WCK43_08965 [bacterium]